MISNRKLSVEDIVKSRCPSCQKVQNHTVIEVVDERSSRIRCNACQEVRTYKGKKAPKQKNACKEESTASRARTAQAANERSEWAALRPGMQPEEAIPYSMSGRFHVRDLVQHVSFGLGLVTRQAGPHKIEVLFQEGKKLLCCQ